MARWETHRVDSTAKGLIKIAQQLGAQYHDLGGALDGLLLHRGTVYLIDWKGPKTKRTKRQQKLVEAGWPIVFIRTAEELQALLTKS